MSRIFSRPVLSNVSACERAALFCTRYSTFMHFLVLTEIRRPRRIVYALFSHIRYTCFYFAHVAIKAKQTEVEIAYFSQMI